MSFNLDLDKGKIRMQRYRQVCMYYYLTVPRSIGVLTCLW